MGKAASKSLLKPHKIAKSGLKTLIAALISPFLEVKFSPRVSHLIGLNFSLVSCDPRLVKKSLRQLLNSFQMLNSHWMRSKVVPRKLRYLR
jgi:hypothetical protein